MNGNLKKMSALTKTYDQYEIVKIPFPFSDKMATKIRPALILSSAKQFNAKIGLSIMAMITSVKSGKDVWAADIVIEYLKIAGLPANVTAR